jgi:protein TonB
VLVIERANAQTEGMIPVVLAFAQIVITGPPPPAAPPAGPHHYVFSNYDYPIEAVKNHWEGTVVVDLVVAADGSPTSCSIVQSSGHQLLDETTCNLIMSRAKFAPGRDKAGNPIESHSRSPSVTWRLNP